MIFQNTILVCCFQTHFIIDIVQQPACLVTEPVTADSNAFLFNCVFCFGHSDHADLNLTPIPYYVTGLVYLSLIIFITVSLIVFHCLSVMTPRVGLETSKQTKRFYVMYVFLIINIGT